MSTAERTAADEVEHALNECKRIRCEVSTFCVHLTDLIGVLGATLDDLREKEITPTAAQRLRSER